MSSSKEEQVDFLKPDETQIPGQRYALISVVSPTSSQKNDMCGIKIKGVFETIEEAQFYAKKLTQLDPLFDIFLVEMYKWLPVPPNSDLIENQNFQDEVLNTIVKTHVEEQYKAKQFFETRKLDLMGGKTDPIEDIANLKIDEADVESDEVVDESVTEADEQVDK